MNRTTYRVEHMDCSAEEQMVRMRLESVEEVARLEFDLPGRTLRVYHHGRPDAISEALEHLALGATAVAYETGVAPVAAAATTAAERRVLWGALGINAALFVGELAAGLLARSMGLVADALDMLADALVYALSLYAVGGAAHRKRRVAAWSGRLQMLLAVAGLIEVGRRFIGAEAPPDFWTMIGVSTLALAGNAATLALLARARSGEAHVEASWIFTSNDVKVNLLVIASGVLVYLTASKLPDLAAGALIFVIVARGARAILALAR